MSESKHTPGPWKAGVGVDGEADRWGVWAAYGNRQWHIATVENGAPGDTLETEAATAHLIAAAPDLLAAVEAMLPLIAHEAAMRSDVFEVYHSARTARDKAKGANQ